MHQTSKTSLCSGKTSEVGHSWAVSPCAMPQRIRWIWTPSGRSEALQSLEWMWHLEQIRARTKLHFALLHLHSPYGHLALPIHQGIPQVSHPQLCFSGFVFSLVLLSCHPTGLRSSCSQCKAISVHCRPRSIADTPVGFESHWAAGQSKVLISHHSSMTHSHVSNEICQKDILSDESLQQGRIR